MFLFVVYDVKNKALESFVDYTSNQTKAVTRPKKSATLRIDCLLRLNKWAQYSHLVCCPTEPTYTENIEGFINPSLLCEGRNERVCQGEKDGKM